MFQRTLTSPAPVCALLGPVLPSANPAESVGALCRPAAQAVAASWKDIEEAGRLNERHPQEWSISDKLRFLILG